MVWAVVASGQSLHTDDIEYIKKAKINGKLKGMVAVSNVGLDLLPDADALVSHDSNWWSVHKKALNFKGRKFCRMIVGGTEQFIPNPSQSCNSGKMAMDVAWKIFNAEKILLLGFDMHGTHYFGRHPEKLKNTNDKQFKVHLRQFDCWNGPEVINCTQGSALQRFPFTELRKVLGC